MSNARIGPAFCALSFSLALSGCITVPQSSVRPYADLRSAGVTAMELQPWQTAGGMLKPVDGSDERIIVSGGPAARWVRPCHLDSAEVQSVVLVLAAARFEPVQLREDQQPSTHFNLTIHRTQEEIMTLAFARSPETDAVVVFRFPGQNSPQVVPFADVSLLFDINARCRPYEHVRATN